MTVNHTLGAVDAPTLLEEQLAGKKNTAAATCKGTAVNLQLPAYFLQFL